MTLLSSTSRINTLQGLRGLAALIVALDHFTLLTTGALPGSTIHQIASFSGSLAVGVFFLISGFVMPMTLASTYSSTFLMRRFFRLYPVFFVCCLIRLMVNVNAGTMALTPETWHIFWLNVSMFGGLSIIPVQNIEPVVWTLAIEVKFYLLCALLWWVSQRQWGRLYKGFIISLLGLIVLAYTFPKMEAPWTFDLAYAVSALPFMMIGLFISLFMMGKINKKQMWWGVLIAAFSYSRAPLKIFVSKADLVMYSYVTATIIFVLAIYFRDRLTWLSSRFCQFLGDISYPMYGVHSAMAILVHLYLPINPYLKLLAFVGGVVVVSYVIHRLVEQPIVDLSKRFGRKAPRV